MAENKDVVVYVTGYCPYCHAAKQFLKSKKVVFREIDVTDDDDARHALSVKAGGWETVPQIFAGEKHIGGYDDLVEFYRKGNKL